MAAKLDLQKQSGQSIIEFLLMIPLLLGLTSVLVRLNQAIQISIVNQQYARAQTLFLTYSSAFYPKVDKQVSLVAKGFNQLVLGVSENLPDATGGDYNPAATTQLVARNPNIVADNTPQFEPPLRAQVRIRNTVTLCTQSLYQSASGGGPVAIQPLGGTPITANAPTNLTEAYRFSDICGSSIKYE